MKFYLILCLKSWHRVVDLLGVQQVEIQSKAARDCSGNSWAIGTFQSLLKSVAESKQGAFAAYQSPVILTCIFLFLPFLRNFSLRPWPVSFWFQTRKGWYKELYGGGEMGRGGSQRHLKNFPEVQDLCCLAQILCWQWGVIPANLEMPVSLNPWRDHPPKTQINKWWHITDLKVTQTRSRRPGRIQHKYLTNLLASVDARHQVRIWVGALPAVGH